MSYKIFLSPSNQDGNRYAAGNTNEAEQCGRIAKALKDALERCGFEVMLMHEEDMATKCRAANAWGADCYIPVHSNACNGAVSGTRLFYYADGGRGSVLCRNVAKYLFPLTPGTSENAKAAPQLYEVGKPDCPVCFVEVDFHDVPSVAEWIIAHTAEIAEAICHGVCDYFDVGYKAREQKIYRVQVGAFTKKENAQAYMDKLKACGFEAYIVEGTR